MITNPQADTNVSREELLRMLAVKQNQINSLLEVTKAVNNNYSKHAIFRIFEFILRAQFNVSKILLLLELLKMENGHVPWNTMHLHLKNRLM